MKKTGIAGIILLAGMLTAGSAAAADYSISWSNTLGTNSSCVKAEATVTDITGTKTTFTTSNSFTSFTILPFSSLTCTSIKLKASCIYSSPSTNENQPQFGSINPELVIVCSSGSAEIIKNPAAINFTPLPHR